ncbi:RNA-dependent RNA polymerase 1 [Hibiscus syriacus]|uniref:RNA-dependent RNA polymerase n=1 Tax=Hibiscus syriacus TaxID=106335 RepID=A0A6A2WED7_HIBSY|nr:RNA-dependent RNA polymerase 1 [Hibiscus syriacus]
MGKTIKLFGFGSTVTVEEVKHFLENYTGEGSVETVKVGQREGGRAHAKVQLKNEDDVERILSWTASQALWHNDSYLRAWPMKHNIIPQPKPKFDLVSIDDLMLHFGYPVSRDKFSVLWNQPNVSFKYGPKLDKLYFFMSYNSVDYKLELFNDNVWRIVLHYLPDQTNKCLVIQWVREVDFTPGNCIGQSFAICLEIPRSVQLPKFDPSLFYKKVEDHFLLQEGSTFSSNTDLVPIINPPAAIHIPYNILFKVNSLVQNGFLPPTTLDSRFFESVDPNRIDTVFIEHALEKMFSLKDCCYEPVKWLNEQYKEYRNKPPRPPVLPEGLVAVRRIQVTPSKVYFSGPDINLSNRVLRNYIKDIDNFLRVSFVDEELGKIHSSDLSSSTSVTDGKPTRIYQRILSTLRNGILIGDKKFEFLACSTSQLRENSIWMFASKPGLTAEGIREKMGHIHVIRNVAKYAARLGQSLSSSRETLQVSQNEFEKIPDIEVKINDDTKYNFSDGIGKISAKLAREVARKCGLRNTPSAFQIRYGGYKGVVAVDPSSSAKLSLRESMQKFDADSTSLDVLSWSKLHPCYLNRQIIILMSTLGVKDSVFEMKQKEFLAQLDAILVDPEKAREAMDRICHGELVKILREMILCGYKPDYEPFLSMMLRTIRASKLLDLRTRTRILIEKGGILMGCLDETGTLEYGQVFVQYSDSKSRQSSSETLLTFNDRQSNRNCHIVEGKVSIAKNPCLHPGDLRVLQVVDVVVLHHMVDCIVFPQKGPRPHPNECSGSDLDGDLYFVSWDEDLIPPCNFPPMDYRAEPTKLLDRDVTMEDVAEYFTNYIINDSLGVISNSHTVFADKESAKAMSEQCIALAKLSSKAVDFPKTGIPAKYPVVYASVNTRISWKSLTAKLSYDPDMEFEGYLAHVNDALHYKRLYDHKLASLMLRFGVKTEAEIISGCILKLSKHYDRRVDLENIIAAVKSLRKEAKGWFNEKVSSSPEDKFAKASAWYHVTYHPSFWGLSRDGADEQHFISFPWCIHDKLLPIKRENSSKDPKSLEIQITGGDLNSNAKKIRGKSSRVAESVDIKSKAEEPNMTAKPDSCIIDVYNEGDHSQPCTWPPWFGKPVCLLFLTECEIAFGRVIAVDHPGDFRGSLKLSLPPGSLLVMEGKSTYFAKHALPSVRKQRILVSFTKCQPRKSVSDNQRLILPLILQSSRQCLPPNRSPNHFRHSVGCKYYEVVPTTVAPSIPFSAPVPVPPGSTAWPAPPPRHSPPHLPVPGTGVFLPPPGSNNSSPQLLPSTANELNIPVDSTSPTKKELGEQRGTRNLLVSRNNTPWGSETDDAELSDCTLMALRYHELADQRKGGN